MSAFAHFLRTQMSQLGWSQTDLADKIGVDKSSISRWLKEERPDPDPQNIAALARATGVPFAHIVELVLTDQGANVDLLTVISNPAPELTGEERRVLAQLRSIEWFPEIAQGLVGLSPANARAILAFLRTLQQQELDQNQTGAHRHQ